MLRSHKGIAINILILLEAFKKIDLQEVREWAAEGSTYHIMNTQGKEPTGQEVGTVMACGVWGRTCMRERS